jgi:predicted nucleotidyltransferase
MSHDAMLDRIVASIHSRDASAQVYLFGSRARGDNRSDSDWDILILLDKPEVSDKIEAPFRDELSKIEGQTGQIISAFIYSMDFWQNNLKSTPLYKIVEKDGIKL